MNADACDGAHRAATRARWLSVGLAVGVALPLVVYLPHVGRWDNDEFVALHALARWNLFAFGPVKQWDPLLCGGVSLAGDPQVPVLAPTALVSYLLGPLLGVRLGVVLLMAVGFAGARRLGRTWFRDEAAASLFAGLFVANGYFAARFAVGHVPHATHLLVPGLLWGVHAVSDAAAAAMGPLGRVRAAATGTVALGLALALALDGSHAFSLYAVPLIALYAGVLAVQRRSVVPLLLTGLALLWGVACDAVFLLPAAAEQLALPADRPATTASLASLLWHALVPTWRPLVTEAWEAHEYTLYVGPVVLALIAARRRAVRDALGGGLGRRLVVVAAVGLALGLGTAWPLLGDFVPTPFDGLRSLPGFSAVRAPSRYWFALLPLVAAAGAAAVRAELAHGGRRGAFVALLVLASVVPHAWAWADRSFSGSPWLGGWGVALGASVAARTTDVHDVGGDRTRMLADLDVHRGVVRCYWPGRRQGPAFHRADRGLVLAVLGPDGEPRSDLSASACFEGWNRIQVSAATSGGEPREERTVVLDQGHHRFWTSSDGTVVRSATGHLAVTLGPVADASGGPPRSVRLQFRDPWSVAGAWLSAVAVAISLAVLGRAAARRRLRGSRTAAGTHSGGLSRPYSGTRRPC